MAKPIRPNNVHPNAPTGRTLRDVMQSAYDKRARDAYGARIKEQRAAADAKLEQRRASERERDAETLQRAQELLEGREVERQELGASDWNAYRMRVEDENASRVSNGHRPWTSEQITERARQMAFVDVAQRTFEARQQNTLERRAAEAKLRDAREAFASDDPEVIQNGGFDLDEATVVPTRIRDAEAELAEARSRRSKIERDSKALSAFEETELADDPSLSLRERARLAFLRVHRKS